MLWGIRHLKKFRQIPEGFLNTIIQQTKKCLKLDAKQLTHDFAASFGDILSDELNSEPMKGDPMII